MWDIDICSIECLVFLLYSQNAPVEQQYSVAAFSSTTEVDEDFKKE